MEMFEEINTFLSEEPDNPKLMFGDYNSSGYLNFERNEENEVEANIVHSNEESVNLTFSTKEDMYGVRAARIAIAKKLAIIDYHNMKPWIDKTTRVDKNSGKESTLDQIFASLDPTKEIITIDTNLSDHKLIHGETAMEYGKAEEDDEDLISNNNRQTELSESRLGAGKRTSGRN